MIEYCLIFPNTYKYLPQKMTVHCIDERVKKKKQLEKDLIAGDSWRHGEGLAHAHALLAVDEEGVVLDGEVLLQGRLGAQQVLQRVLCFAELSFQVVHGLVDLIHLFHQSVVNKRSLVEPFLLFLETYIENRKLINYKYMYISCMIRFTFLK